MVFIFFLSPPASDTRYIFKGEGLNEWFSSRFDQNRLPDFANTLANVCEATTEREGGIADNSLRSVPQSWQLV